MEEKKKYKIKTEEIAQIKLDFNKIKQWRDPDNDDLPVYGFSSFYKACGLEEVLRKYSEEHGKVQFVAFDNLLCNLETLKKIKDLIKDHWACYSLAIEEDNHVFWDTKKWKKGQKHYKKTLSDKVEANLNKNFMDYSPQPDIDVGDDIIVFQVYEKVYEENEEEKHEES